MTDNEIIVKLKTMQKKHRFNHTLGVVKEAERLAPRFGVDVKKARITAMLHDCAKNLDEIYGEDFSALCQKYGVMLDDCARCERALVHAFLGAAVAYKDFGIDDNEILEAIYYHTTARANMTPLEKLIYIADMTEPGRTIEQADEIRRLVEEDIDEALIYAIGCSITHVIRKGTLIHPDSVHALNYLIEHRRAKA
ncbi:MAG: bis(5'-nucleosyl)-tetraphosphatase (symmetrical) YqeK [Clostridia bacterium]|nr:bis(5'-nucleosyl)-tetraphosphatase (symmetrical) YqeK [Clostridia bacterium]